MDVVIAGATLVAVDGIYLSLFGKPRFSTVVRRIQGSPLKVNLLAALITYAALVFVFYWFLIRNCESSSLDAFILGACTYLVYDGTTKAIFSRYDWLTAGMDALWGGILFTIVHQVWKKSRHL